MLCCCVSRSRSGSSSSSSRSKSRLKDVVMIATCCISFVAAFAVAMTTIAHAGARNLAVSVSLLTSIVILPPVLVSLCLSRLTASTSHQSQDQLHHDDQETAAAHEFLELEQLSWTRFQEFDVDSLVLTSQEPAGRSSLEGYLRTAGGMQEVLIRKLELSTDQLQVQSEQDVGDFRQEIVKLGSLRRCNVLPMLGFALDHSHSHLLLFMPKLRSLTDVLRNPGLSWRCRCRVAALTARGLCRLHHHHPRAAGTAAEPIVHGNIRSENILLLEEERPENSADNSTPLCTPYIVDTGLLKLKSMPVFRAADTTPQVDQLTGSGYAAPESCTGGGVSAKGDVYSFGILLYVLLSGRTEALAELKPGKALSNKLERIMDVKLGKAYDSTQAKLMQHTALKCTHSDPVQRPDMIRVEAMLRPLLSC